MRNKTIYYFMFLFLVGTGLILGYINFLPGKHIRKNSSITVASTIWNPVIAKDINASGIGLTIDGKEVKIKENKPYMTPELSLMLPEDILSETFDCAVHVYNKKKMIVQKGNHRLIMNLNKDTVRINGEKRNLQNPLIKQEDVMYVSVEAIMQGLNYDYNWDVRQAMVAMNNRVPEERSIPYAYSYLDEKRAPEIKSQGSLGTCWAFASLTALESSLLPEQKYDFSEDHLSLNHSFNISQEEGGEYAMVIAYLSAWQGPVLEKDDPYADGKTNPKLKPKKHVQQVEILASKDLEAIKKMVFQHGGVQSSLYTSMISSYSSSIYYNSEKAAYCYIGTEKPNHDVVIIGWDDNYPKENFTVDIEGDGAFLCRNSWGEDFGENGNFYVSYYDTNIGIHNVAYTRVDDVDNYDNIYQSDLCGWVGSMGFNKRTEDGSVYFSNVYTTKQKEELKAVSFYATGVDTSYTVYVCENFENSNSLVNRIPVATGQLKNAGYYTVDLDRTISLKEKQKYAIIVKISTPNTTKPIAVEYHAEGDTITESVDLTDGEGYYSINGKDWENTEEVQKCNVCLKAFTNNMKEEKAK